MKCLNVSELYGNCYTIPSSFVNILNEKLDTHLIPIPNH